MSKKPVNSTLKDESIQGEQLDLLDGFFDTDEPSTMNTPSASQATITINEPTAPPIMEEPTIQDPIIDEPKHKGSDGTLYTTAEWESPVIHEGPSRKEVEGWKSRYTHVYFTPFDGEVYVWRTLQRPEYREIIRDATLTALDREEMFTEKCVLFPYDFSLEKIKKSRAGIASLLSEMIMDKSGFVAQSAPIKL